MASNEHSAAASASGYLYQTNWALLNLLRQASTRPDQVISLEMHDDVSWEDTDGTATELLQTKLHANTHAGLGDKDTDIWKTLHIWMKRDDATDPNGPELALVTTSTAKPASAAYALRPDATCRNVEVAMQRLTNAAQESTAQATEAGREMFLALTHAERATFLSRVRVLDGELPIEDLDEGVRQALTFALPSGKRAQSLFIGEVWRWWAGVAVDMLAGRRAGVEVGQVIAFVQDLRDGFGPENLWTTVQLGDVTEEDVAQYTDERFVAQMRLVQYPRDNLRRAVVDYHRAVTQETVWLDDSLLGLHELKVFEDNLREEWSRTFIDMLDDLAGGMGEYDADGVDEVVKVKAGKALLRTLLGSTTISIRKQYDDPFFARGKRHELANRQHGAGIGWHPDFAVRLEAVVSSA